MIEYTDEEIGLMDGYAGLALMALIQRDYGSDMMPEDHAELSYKYAAAMVAQRRTLRSDDDGRN